MRLADFYIILTAYTQCPAGRFARASPHCVQARLCKIQPESLVFGLSRFLQLRAKRPCYALRATTAPALSRPDRVCLLQAITAFAQPLRSPPPPCPYAAIATAFYVRLRQTRGSAANGHGSGGGFGSGYSGAGLPQGRRGAGGGFVHQSSAASGAVAAWPCPPTVSLRSLRGVRCGCYASG